MKLIIDIDESLYNRVKEKIVALSDIPVLCKAVDDSTPYNPSGDYISREALKKTISELPNANPSYWNKCDVVDRADLLDEIDNAQAVEFSLLPLSGEADDAYMRGYEVGKAEGILKANTRPQGSWETDNIGIYCSVCKKHLDVETPFCPLCGADMRGGANMNYEIIAGRCPIEVGGDCPLKSKGRYIDLDLAKRIIAKFDGYLDEDMITRIQIALEKESKAEND